MKYLLVGGDFNNDGGRPSGYVAKLASVMKAIEPDVMVVNGGSVTDVRNVLYSQVPPTFREFGVVFWFANVPNEEEKLVNIIKTIHPRCILVTSKRNNWKADKREYSFQQIIQHALKLKSNLVVQFSKEYIRGQGRVFWHLFDPLANEYPGNNGDITVLATTMMARVKELAKFTRIGSKQVGSEIPCPDQPEFFEIIREHADVFHKLIHPGKTERFLGNSSFRCTKGFPSFRNDGLIFMSRRNIDKRSIGPESFVAVRTDSLDRVEYYGLNKPSVDTPIQLRLYRYFPNINYILHGHVYLSNSSKTNRPVPCGSIEEFYEIISKAGARRESTLVKINLRGHGFIVMSKNVDDFRAILYESRTTNPETPENQGPVR